MLSLHAREAAPVTAGARFIVSTDENDRPNSNERPMTTAICRTAQTVQTVFEVEDFFEEALRALHLAFHGSNSVVFRQLSTAKLHMRPPILISKDIFDILLDK